MTDKALDIRPMPASSLAPTNLREAMEFADMMARSSIVPKDYQGKPENVLVAVQWGMELGLAPMQAMQNIAVINGRPSIWGDAMLAICKSHPQFESIDESSDANGATCVVKRKGQPVVRQTFTKEDAKRAGLTGKQGPWQQYPERMMQMRARSFALRDAFPDALKGIRSAEEAQDIPRERDMGAADVVHDPAQSSRVESVKQKLKSRQTAAQPATEHVDIETGEVLEQPAPWTYETIMRDLANCQDIEALDMLRDAARSIYHDLEQGQKAQLTKAINALEAELSAPDEGQG